MWTSGRAFAVAGMGEPAGGILRGDGSEGGPDGGAVVVECPGLGGAEEGLDLREGLLDRVEAGRAPRGVAELGSQLVDRLAGAVTVVDLEVVDDRDLARLERR